MVYIYLLYRYGAYLFTDCSIQFGDIFLVSYIIYLNLIISKIVRCNVIESDNVFAVE